MLRRLFVGRRVSFFVFIRVSIIYQVDKTFRYYSPELIDKSYYSNAALLHLHS